MAQANQPDERAGEHADTERKKWRCARDGETGMAFESKVAELSRVILKGLKEERGGARRSTKPKNRRGEHRYDRGESAQAALTARVTLVALATIP